MNDECSNLGQLMTAEEWEELAKRAGYSTAKMASLCCVSERQLQRRFKQHLGCTPSQWLRELKCRMAQKLIAQGYSSKAAAMELHFATESHFCHSFKRVFGQPPQSFAPNRGASLSIPSLGKALDLSTAPRAESV